MNETYGPGVIVGSDCHVGDPYRTVAKLCAVPGRTNALVAQSSDFVARGEVAFMNLLLFGTLDDRLDVHNELRREAIDPIFVNLFYR